MKTIAEMAQLIGQTGTYQVGRGGSSGLMTIPVRILDVRQVFDRTDVKIEPVGGDGWNWVDLNAVRLEEGGE